VLGSPAVPVREQRRIFQMIARLPEMHRQLRELIARIAVLSAAVSQRPEQGPDLGNGCTAESGTDGPKGHPIVP
jgi:UDP-3-O-[3-hydroxymyristoyl] glucosamine N-acyltransferase